MDAYDSDDACPRSPLLEPQTIRYTPSESPPPFLPKHCSSFSPKNTPPSSPARSKKRAKKRRKRIQPSHSDSVLISYLDPNRPEIAREARERALNSASQSEAGWSDDVETGDRPDLPPNDQASNMPDLATLAQDSLIHIDASLEGSDPPGPQQHEPSNGFGFPVVNGFNRYDVAKESLGSVNLKNAGIATFLQNLAKSSLKGRRTPKIKISSDERSRDESLVTSPNLRKFTISSSEGSPMQQLPAIQKSPCQSASPDGAQSLPSLSTALAGAEINDQDARMDGGASPSGRTAYPPLAGQSPPLNRTDRQIPAHYPLHQQSSTSSSFAQLSPQSSKEIQGMSPAGLTHPQNGPLPPNGPFTSSGFKCTHPRCIAALFQTQYLLNSHANVHSQNRPHYCSVKACSRGFGGTGFKRKNEMIRHGLIHDSPGRVCPFCPEKQHRYPRPDNLQKHARVHHVGKDRGGPQLRHVLAQRPAGGNRGRRRRIGGS